MSNLIQDGGVSLVSKKRRRGHDHDHDPGHDHPGHLEHDLKAAVWADRGVIGM